MADWIGVDVAESTCIAEGCEKPRRYTAGWCPMHYQRVKNRGTSDPPPPRVKPTCPCGEPARSRGLCRACYRRDHYERNKAHENATARAYYEAHAEDIRARGREWTAANRERRAEYYQRNRDRQQAQRRELMKDPARRQAVRDKAREWRRNSPLWPLRNRENQRRRRRVDGKPVDYAAILAEHGMFCHICWLVIVDESDLHFDHVIPLALGGPHCAENIRPAHALCNIRKGAKPAA